MIVPSIFASEVDQINFEKMGYVVIPDFLKLEEVQLLSDIFDELHPVLPAEGFFSGSYSTDFSFKKKVSEKIKEVYQRAYGAYFVNYTPFGGTFLVKMPTENSDLFIHQDWTVVDESKHVALNVWVPLCDITLENGPLMVIPGSHYANYPTLRAPTMRYFFDHDVETAMRELEPILVKAGTAVVLNQSIVHYSPPNRSGSIRKAITAGIKTKDAQMIFHYLDPEKPASMIEKFEMDDDFFIQFDDFFTDIFKRPAIGKSLGMLEYSVPMLSGNELKNKFRSMRLSAGFKPTQTDLIKVDSTTFRNSSFFATYTPKNIFFEMRRRIKKLL
jgi:hypothetical protein